MDEFDLMFRYEESPLLVKGEVFRVLRDAIERWPVAFPKPDDGNVADFEVLYELKDHRFLMVRYPACVARKVERSGLELMVMGSPAMPRSRFVTLQSAVRFLAKHDCYYPSRIDDMLAGKHEVTRTEKKRRPRSLSHWASKPYVACTTNISARNVQPLESAQAIVNDGVEVIQLLSSGKELSRQWDLDAWWRLSGSLFGRYRVLTRDWWGPWESVPPSHVFLTELPWPDNAHHIRDTIRQLQQFLIGPVHVIQPTYRMDDPERPTRAEQELGHNYLKTNLQKFNGIICLLRQQLIDYGIEPQTPEPQTQTPKSKSQEMHKKMAFLGIIVDETTKTISRVGYKTTFVNLRQSKHQWHLFWKIFQGKGKAISLSELMLDYQGEKERWYGVQNALNKKLRQLDIRIEDRCLVNGSNTPRKKQSPHGKRKLIRTSISK